MSQLAVVVQFAVAGKRFKVNVAIVPCQVPFLFLKEVLVSLGTNYDIVEMDRARSE